MTIISQRNQTKNVSLLSVSINFNLPVVLIVWAKFKNEFTGYRLFKYLFNLKLEETLIMRDKI